MPFTPAQAASLLAQQSIGNTILQRLQQMGLDDVALLAAADVDTVLQQGAAITHSSCWRNSPQARAAIQTAIAWATQQRITP